nr:hypothetical protein Iba_chr02bCG14710 [Ipomoea batatas]
MGFGKVCFLMFLAAIIGLSAASTTGVGEFMVCSYSRCRNRSSFEKASCMKFCRDKYFVEGYCLPQRNSKPGLVRLLPRIDPGFSIALRRWSGAWGHPRLRHRPDSRCGLRRWSSRNLHDGDRQITPLRDRGERGRTGIRNFLRKNGQDVRQVGLVHRYLQSGFDVVLHRPSPAVKGPSTEFVHQVFLDRSSRDCCKNGLSGLLASADVAGEQDGIGEDFFSQIRALQDPSPGLFGRLELALKLLDPLVPLGKRLLEGRYFTAMDLVPVLSPGEEAMRSPTKAVDHPLVFSGGGAAAQILDSRVAGGSSPCFISTPGIAMIAALAGGERGGQGQPGAGGRAETGKLLIVPENQTQRWLAPVHRTIDLRSPTSTNLVSSTAADFSQLASFAVTAFLTATACFADGGLHGDGDGVLRVLRRRRLDEDDGLKYHNGWTGWTTTDGGAATVGFLI